MGFYLSQPKKDKLEESGKNEFLEFAVSAMQGWRLSMEDSHIAKLNIADNVHLFAVFDGHGGSAVAKYCGDNFTKLLVETQEFKNKNYKEALCKTMQIVDENLEKDGLKLLEQYKEQQNTQVNDMQPQESINSAKIAGCTAVVLLIVQNKYYIANVGDSRIVLFKKDGSHQLLTLDHKPDDPKEKTRIEKAGGMVANGRVNGNLNLSRALGDLEFKENKSLKPDEQLIVSTPDITEYEFNKDDDFFLIGCDGVWELHDPQQLKKSLDVNLNQNYQQRLNHMLDTCVAETTTEGLGCDNLSSILVKINFN